jgi:hypothetical protein
MLKTTGYRSQTLKATCYILQQTPVIVTTFLKIPVLYVVLDWQEIYKTVIEKAFVFILLHFYLFLVLLLKNLKNGPSER